MRKRLRICGIHYSIEEATPETHPGEIDADDCGACLHTKGKILIAKGLASDVSADTLMHEILHAIFQGSGASNEITAELEERLIRMITPHLLDVWGQLRK